MKKLILFFFAVLLLTSLTNAQNFGKQGVWEVGGTVMYANTKLVANGETVDGSVGIFFGNVPAYYFIMEGLEIGIIPEFLSVTASQELAGSETTLSAFGGYFSAAYVFNTGGNVYPYLEGRVGYNSVNITADVGSILKTASTQQTALDETLSGIGYGFSGGIKIQIARGALLNFGVGYQMRTVNPENYDGDRNGVNVIVAAAGFSIFLGR